MSQPKILDREPSQVSVLCRLPAAGGSVLELQFHG
jgi:hypothetical protein